MLRFLRSNKIQTLNEKDDPLKTIWSFSKIITIVWIVVWIETVIFSQCATIFSFGDAVSIQVINDNTKEIGMIITGAYFSSKCFENIAKGYEEWRLKMLEPTDSEECYDECDEY